MKERKKMEERENTRISGRVAQSDKQKGERERKRDKEFLVFLMTLNFKLVWKYKKGVWKYQ